MSEKEQSAAQDTAPPAGAATGPSPGVSGTTNGKKEPVKKDIGIPHHMQDKDGFCGAACIMMLLAHRGVMKTQSEIMRMIKKKRDLKNRGEQTEKPPSSRMAWHASPEEIREVLKHFSPDPEWNLADETETHEVMGQIDDSIAAGIGAIALVWAPKAGTAHPHWVVVTGMTFTAEPKKPKGCVTEGYVILDPTAPGRPDAALRYEAIEHSKIGPIPETGEVIETCPCQMWKDCNGREQTAMRIWVPLERMEEMLDEGAVRGVGLRYAIVGPAVTNAAGLPFFKPDPNGKPQCAEHTVEDRIRRRRLKERAEIFLKEVEKKGLPVKMME